jgi:S1-C subfamily serine protease
MRTRRSPIHILLASALAAAVAAVAVGVVTTWHAAGSTPPAVGRLLAADSANAGVVVVETNLGDTGGAAAGTGMVLTDSGEVLTNNHVIAGATAIRVLVPDTGRTYTAQVVGYDVSADTAVIQLQGASGLATVSTASGAALATGQTVRAVGNAGGTGSLTTVNGTITGLDQRITAGDDRGGSEQLSGLIETNAPIQPGDSGGPLLDDSGRVIGMDTAASTGNGGFADQAAAASDAYAIPIGTALNVVQQITAGRSSDTVHIGDTAFLGVQLTSPDQGYDPGYGGGFGYGDQGGYGYGDGSGPSTAGALVAGVVSGSPADDAGLSYGDEITAIDGTAITSVDQVGSLIGKDGPGSKIAVTWLDASGNQQTSTVTLASGPPR